MFLDHEALHKDSDYEALKIYADVLYEEVQDSFPQYVKVSLVNYKDSLSNNHIFYDFKRKAEILSISKLEERSNIINRYDVLINCLTEHPEAKIVNITKNQVVIEVLSRLSMTRFTINEYFSYITIDWFTNMYLLGKLSDSWTFPKDYAQDQIIQDLSNFLVEKHNQNFRGLSKKT